MVTDEHKREQREKAREERLPLLSRQETLSDNYCSICPMNSTHNESGGPEDRCAGCPVYAELRGIGNGLLDISTKYYIMPERLTYDTYLAIRDKLEWSKKQIAKYYGIRLTALNDYLYWFEQVIPDTQEEESNVKEDITIDNVHRIVPQKEEKPEDALTVDVYLDMQSDGKSDVDIIRELNITQHIMNKFKNANGLVGKRGPQKKTKAPKKEVTKETPKEQPLKVYEHKDVAVQKEQQEQEQFEKAKQTQGRIQVHNTGEPSIGLGKQPVIAKLDKVFIVMDSSKGADADAIKAVRSTKELALMFIAEYVLENKINTAYLELVEKIIDAEE